MGSSLHAPPPAEIREVNVLSALSDGSEFGMHAKNITCCLMHISMGAIQPPLHLEICGAG